MVSCMNRREDKRQQQSIYAGRKKKFSKELEVGQNVDVQDEKSGKWCYRGIIRRKRDSGVSYDVEFCKPGNTPKIYLRNRKFLKEIKNVHYDCNEPEEDTYTNRDYICKQNKDGEVACTNKGRKHSMKLRNKNVQRVVDPQCDDRAKRSKQIHGCQANTAFEKQGQGSESRRARQSKQGYKGEQLTRRHKKSQ